MLLLDCRDKVEINEGLCVLISGILGAWGFDDPWKTFMHIMSLLGEFRACSLGLSLFGVCWISEFGNEKHRKGWVL